MGYQDFIQRKTHLSGEFGFTPNFYPDNLFDFQKYLVEWAVKKGRAALFADCGMGKTPMQLTFAENVVRHTNKNTLILTPLSVAKQTVKEAEKFGIEANQSKDGSPKGKITVTNYEKLHMFSPDEYNCLICDESSIIKHNGGATQKAVTRFINKMPYRLLCTATASPNDWPELGNSSEALGELSYSEMLSRFFRQLDDKGQKKAAKEQIQAEKAAAHHYMKLAFRVSQSIGQWRLKNHAVNDFWKWVASWAKACRMPSDLGFSNGMFVLPELVERDHIVEPTQPLEGFLFTMPAIGLKEEREERKRTITERCELAAQLVNHDDPATIWCHTNAEGDLLEKVIDGAVQVAGRTHDDQKEEIYDAFLTGEIKKLVIKPKIGAFGLNWQHCAHAVTFASHSYEQYYQLVRRHWRFGQTSPVKIDTIASKGEARVTENLRRKAQQADVMFERLVTFMNNSRTIERKNNYTTQEEIPSWL